MLRPNDLPLICLPTALPDEAAVELLEFLHELIEALERHYAAQLRRHYQRSRYRHDDPDCAGDDPPF